MHRPRPKPRALGKVHRTSVLPEPSPGRTLKDIDHSIVDAKIAFSSESKGTVGKSILPSEDNNKENQFHEADFTNYRSKETMDTESKSGSSSSKDTERNTRILNNIAVGKPKNYIRESKLLEAEKQTDELYCEINKLISQSDEFKSITLATKISIA